MPTKISVRPRTIKSNSTIALFDVASFEDCLHCLSLWGGHTLQETFTIKLTEENVLALIVYVVVSVYRILSVFSKCKFSLKFN